jgi:hypothetical protein
MPTIQAGGLSTLALGGFSVVFGFVPLLAATLVAILGKRRSKPFCPDIVPPLAAGVWIYASYTTLFTAGFTLWHWYYVAPIILGAIALAAAADAVTRNFRWRPARLGFAAVLTVVAALILVRSPRRDPLSDQLTAWVRANVPPGETVLVSELPGQVAYFTDARVVAADMLTGNRRLVDDLVRSGNALDALLTRSRERGSPIRYIVHVGGMFLNVLDGGQKLEYRNPRMVHNRETIGELRVGLPLASEGKLVAWRAPTDQTKR